MAVKFNPFTGTFDLTGEANPLMVTGPGSSTDNAVARFDGTTGIVIQNSNAILTDVGDLSVTGTITASNLSGTNTGDQDLSQLVTGPASAVDNDLVLFDGVTGKLVKDSGVTLAEALAVDQTNTIYVDGALGDDTTGTGSIKFPYATITKAGTVIGGAVSNAEFNDATKRYYHVIVAPGVYTENPIFGTRPSINLSLMAGALIIGNLTSQVDQGAIFGAGLQSPSFSFTGPNARSLAGGAATIGLQGDLITESINTGSSLVTILHVRGVGITGKISKIKTGLAGGYTLTLFIEGSIVQGNIEEATGTSGITLYADNCNDSSSNSLGGVTGSVILNIINDIRFNGAVISTATTHGRWFNTEFRSGQAHDFSAFSGTVSADANSYASFQANVPSKGTGTFTRLDDSEGVRYSPTTSANWASAPIQVEDALDKLAVSGVAKTQTANTVLSGPSSGGAALPTFRALVAADIPAISLTTGVTGILPVANGGTNSSTALNNNRVIQSSSGSIVEAAAITASRALISDANGIPTHSSVTSTELGYVSGVTSSIQTQIDSKVAKAGDTMTGFLTLNADPVSALHAATKQYVDNGIQGFKPKAAVRVATTANINLATDLENGDIIDGETLVTGDRVLVKDQTAAEDNGIYIVPVSGAASRSTDFDSITPIDEINGAYVPVQEGTLNTGKFFVQSGTVTTLGVDPINFVFFNSIASLIGGDGIDITTDIVSVDHDGEGLTFDTNQLALELDGGTLFKSASGLKVADDGIGTTQIADDAVTRDQINADVAGDGLQQNVNGSLEINLEDTDPSLKIVSDELGVKFSSTVSGLQKDSTGLRIQLEATNPSLQINGSNELGINFGTDIRDTAFSGANNQSSAADVTGLAFSNASVRAFETQVSVFVDATSDLYEAFSIKGIQRGADWIISTSSEGDDSQIVFSITTLGQIQYTSANYAGFSALTMHFRAETLSV